MPLTHRVSNTGTLQTTTTFNEIVYTNKPQFRANSIIAKLDEVTKPAGPKLRMANTGIIYTNGQFDEYNFFAYTSKTGPMITTSAPEKTFDAVGQISTTAESVVLFDTTGTKMYINSNATKTLYQYTLSSAWDVSTAIYANKSLNHSAQTTGGSYNNYGLAFKPDGTSVFVQYMGTRFVYEYAMSIPWDISTAYYTYKAFQMSQTYETGFDIATDGTSIYTCDPINDGVYQYNLSTPWDISTASFYVRYNTTSLLSVGPQAIRWVGPYNFYVYNQGLYCHQFKTSVAWNVFSIYVTYIGVGGYKMVNQADMYFKPDSTKAYFPDSNTINQWSVTPGNP